MRKHRTGLTSLARNLRKQSTDAERRLWQLLRSRQLEGIKFRRQLPVGRYIADFACIERHLIVELDGGQHAENAAADAERTAYLQGQGWQVLRFWNDAVLTQGDAVVEGILRALAEGDRVAS